MKNVIIPEWQRFVGLKQNANFCIIKKSALVYLEK